MFDSAETGFGENGKKLDPKYDEDRFFKIGVERREQQNIDMTRDTIEIIITIMNFDDFVKFLNIINGIFKD